MEQFGPEDPDTSAHKRIPQSVLEDLRFVEERSLDSAERLYGRALVAFRREDHAQAEALLSEYARSAPMDGWAQYWLGHTLLHLHRFAESEEVLSKALRCNVRSAETLRGRAAALSNQGKFEEALHDLACSLRIQTDARVFLARADIYQRQRRFDAALEEIDAAFRLAPRSAKASRLRADLRLLKGDLPGSEADYSASLAVEENCCAFAGRASARRQQGNLRGAEQDVEAALGKKARCKNGYLLRGYLRFDQGRFSEAVADFDASIAIRPQSDAFLGRAQALIMLAKADDALADLNQVIERDAANAGAHALRAFLRTVRGDPRAGLRDAETALRLDPRLAHAWLERARARAALGDRKGAREDCEQALRYAPPSFRESIEVVHREVR